MYSFIRYNILTIRILELSIILLIAINMEGRCQNESSNSIKWGNAFYMNLTVGESVDFLGKSVRLVSMENNWCTVEVDGVSESLIVARRALPTMVNGIRIFVADNRNIKELTQNENFPKVHDALTKDVLLCLSDPSKPLLDPNKFTFPVDRSDGFIWNKSTNSHMFGYLRPTRTHEGLDINLASAKGQEINGIVSVEEGIVRWKTDGAAHQSCLLIESKSSPGIYYIYQHLNRETVSLKEGDEVKKGQLLGYIWGDNRWGHLHFAIKGTEGVPEYKGRYIALLNCFPQLYELWNGDLTPPTPLRTFGHFHFAKNYWLNGNEQCLNGFDDILGYGWELGTWNTPWTVESSKMDEGQAPDQSAVLRKTLHKNSGRPATNPKDYFDFEITVSNADYLVKAKLGNNYGLTWQKVEFEGVDAGTYELDEGELKWTDEKRVKVSDGKLTVRFYLKDEITEAGVYELYFIMAP